MTLTRQAFPLILAFGLGAACVAVSVGQERAGASQTNADTVNDQINLTVLQKIMDEVNANYTRACAGGHAHGTTWVVPCVAPLTGPGRTMACTSGVAYIQNDQCQPL